MFLIIAGPLSEGSVFYSEMLEESRYIMKSLRAYLCAGVVDWMTEYVNSPGVKQENGNESEDKLNEEHSDVWSSFPSLLKSYMSDIITKESLQYFQDAIKIKKWEHEIASAVAKSRKGEITNDDGSEKSTPDDDTERTFNSDSGTDTILHKLELLKERKQQFEIIFNKTPNPFLLYIKIRNLLAQNESENYKELSELFENTWKEATVQD